MIEGGQGFFMSTSRLVDIHIFSVLQSHIEWTPSHATLRKPEPLASRLSHYKRATLTFYNTNCFLNRTHGRYGDMVGEERGENRNSELTCGSQQQGHHSKVNQHVYTSCSLSSFLQSKSTNTT